MSVAGPMGVIRDHPPVVGGASGLEAYARVVAAGDSVIVRPREGFDGLDRVVEQVRGLSVPPVWVTDLDGPPTRFDAEPGPDASTEPLLAFHSSGSTGSPKCVVYRRGTVTAHARAIADALGLRSDAEVSYLALPPPRFAYGLSIVHSHLVAGVPVTFAEAAWGLPALVDLAERSTGPLTVYALPQHAPLLLAANVDPARLTRILIAGGRLSSGAARALADRFGAAMLTNMYGQAELGPRLTRWHGPLREFVEGTIGDPLPGVHLEIRPRADAPDDPIGEIHATTPYAMWRHIPPPYTDARPGPGDAAVRTGDLGRVSPDGEFHHEGRSDHVLNVAGTKVDVRALTRLLEAAFTPVAVRISSRPGRVGGDVRPVVEIVPGAVHPTRAGVRRVLHAEIGSLAGLCDIQVVDRLNLGESGK